MRPLVVSFLLATLSTPTSALSQLIGRHVAWGVDGGSISHSGLYTAPSVPGTYYVTASSEGLSATATVIVLAKPPHPLPWKEIIALCAALRCDRMVRAAASEVRWRTRRPIGFRVAPPALLALAGLTALIAAAASGNATTLRAA